MAKNKVTHKRSVAESEVSLLEIPEGYSVNGTFRILLFNREENFEEFTGRVDNLSNDIRNSIVRKVANKLGVDVRFTE